MDDQLDDMLAQMGRPQGPSRGRPMSEYTHDSEYVPRISSPPVITPGGVWPDVPLRGPAVPHVSSTGELSVPQVHIDSIRTGIVLPVPEPPLKSTPHHDGSVANVITDLWHAANTKRLQIGVRQLDGVCATSALSFIAGGAPDLARPALSLEKMVAAECKMLSDTQENKGSRIFHERSPNGTFVRVHPKQVYTLQHRADLLARKIRCSAMRIYGIIDAAGSRNPEWSRAISKALLRQPFSERLRTDWNKEICAHYRCPEDEGQKRVDQLIVLINMHGCELDTLSIVEQQSEHSESVSCGGGESDYPVVPFIRALHTCGISMLLRDRKICPYCLASYMRDGTFADLSNSLFDELGVSVDINPSTPEIITVVDGPLASFCNDGWLAAMAMLHNREMHALNGNIISSEQEQVFIPVEKAPITNRVATANLVLESTTVVGNASREFMSAAWTGIPYQKPTQHSTNLALLNASEKFMPFNYYSDTSNVATTYRSIMGTLHQRLNVIGDADGNVQIEEALYKRTRAPRFLGSGPEGADGESDDQESASCNVTEEELAKLESDWRRSYDEYVAEADESNLEREYADIVSVVTRPVSGATHDRLHICTDRCELTAPKGTCRFKLTQAVDWAERGVQVGSKAHDTLLSSMREKVAAVKMWLQLKAETHKLLTTEGKNIALLTSRLRADIGAAARKRSKPTAALTLSTDSTPSLPTSGDTVPIASDSSDSSDSTCDAYREHAQTLKWIGVGELNRVGSGVLQLTEYALEKSRATFDATTATAITQSNFGKNWDNIGGVFGDLLLSTGITAASLALPSDYRRLAIKVALYEQLRERRITQPSGVDWCWAERRMPSREVVMLDRYGDWTYEAIFVTTDYLNKNMRGASTIDVAGGNWSLRDINTKVIVLLGADNSADVGTAAWVISHLTYPLVQVIENFTTHTVGQNGPKRERYVRTAGLVSMPVAAKRLVIVIPTRSRETIVFGANEYRVFMVNRHGEYVRDGLATPINVNEDIEYMLACLMDSPQDLRDAWTRYVGSFICTPNWVQIDMLVTILTGRWHQRVEGCRTRDGVISFLGAPMTTLRAMGLTPSKVVVPGAYSDYGGSDAVNAVDARFIDRISANSFPFMLLGHWDNTTELAVGLGLCRFFVTDVETIPAIQERLECGGVDMLNRSLYIRRAFENYKKSLGIADDVAFYNGARYLPRGWNKLIGSTSGLELPGTTVMWFMRWGFTDNVEWSFSAGQAIINGRRTLTGRRTNSGVWRCTASTSWASAAIAGRSDSNYDFMNVDNSTFHDRWVQVGVYKLDNVLDDILMRADVNIMHEGFEWMASPNNTLNRSLAWLVDSSIGASVGYELGWVDCTVIARGNKTWGWGLTSCLKNWSTDNLLTLTITRAAALKLSASNYDYGTWLSMGGGTDIVIGINRDLMDRPMGVDVSKMGNVRAPTGNASSAGPIAELRQAALVQQETAPSRQLRADSNSDDARGPRATAAIVDTGTTSCVTREQAGVAGTAPIGPPGSGPAPIIQLPSEFRRLTVTPEAIPVPGSTQAEADHDFAARMKTPKP